MEVKIVTTERERELVYSIRKKVFVEEQHVPIEEEIDKHEDEAIHFICYSDGKAVGASRLRIIDNYGKLERICVLKEFRGQSLGKQIIVKMEEIALKHGCNLTKLHAQTHAEQFYKHLGYTTVSDEFMDAGIPHVAMIKKLIHQSSAL